MAIVGHSGAGKTTLTKLIMAEESPTDGTVFFESTDINKLSRKNLTKFRRKIGVVFQNLKRKFIKDRNVNLKTKNPVRVLVTNNKLG